jgi:hypothetical protein
MPASTFVTTVGEFDTRISVSHAPTPPALRGEERLIARPPAE